MTGPPFELKLPFALFGGALFPGGDWLRSARSPERSPGQGHQLDADVGLLRFDLDRLERFSSRVKRSGQGVEVALEPGLEVGELLPQRGHVLAGAGDVANLL